MVSVDSRPLRRAPPCQPNVSRHGMTRRDPSMHDAPAPPSPPSSWNNRLHHDSHGDGMIIPLVTWCILPISLSLKEPSFPPFFAVLWRPNERINSSFFLFSFCIGLVTGGEHVVSSAWRFWSLLYTLFLYYHLDPPPLVLPLRI